MMYFNAKPHTSYRKPSGDHVNDWESAHEFIQHGRNKNDRPLCNNTRLHSTYCTREECVTLNDTLDNLEMERRYCYSVKLHATYVVTYHCSLDGAIELNTGGWDTVTTKDRINRFAPRWLTVGSQRRYIPLAERIERIRRYAPLRAQDQTTEEAIKESARQMTKTESTLMVWVRDGFRRDPETYERSWEYSEALEFVDRMVVLPPPSVQESRSDRLDPEREVEHRLATTVRSRSW